ncbi:MAG: Mor transcription activator family protein [Gallionella sp.]
MRDNTKNTNVFDSAHGYPGVLAEIADAIGEDAAMTIANQYGGTRLYVPKRIQVVHPLAELLGMEAAQKLASVLGGQDHFDIPQAVALKRAKRNAQIFADRAEGASVSELARKNSMSERNIRAIFAARRVFETTKQKPSGKPTNRFNLQEKSHERAKHKATTR